jgi:threonylcarbamoyladenosine tRNA methylthiotransferase MtaB
VSAETACAPLPAATVLTHGCRANLAERDALAALAPAGSTVINSCAVTAQAVRDARAAARLAAKSGPVFVTGCAATLEPGRFADIATVVPNALKLAPATWQRRNAPAAVTRQSRGFLAIQDGCDHSCTFCVTRLLRGPSRSLPLEEAVGHAAALAAEGVNEVVLTGIDSSSWGSDHEGRPRLGHLVQQLLARVPGLPRLRLSSIDAAEADDALVEAFADARLMPHLHLSLQSGDDLVLKRMKRRHGRADALRLADRLRRVRPDIALGADLIAGFPTESEQAHANSRALLADMDLVHAHVFPYSPRPGTAAARMPQLPPATARRRAAELRADAADRLQAFAQGQLGRPQESVSEGQGGLTGHGLKLAYAAPQPRGALVTLTPRRAVAGRLAA